MTKNIILSGLAILFALSQAFAELRFKNIYQSNMLLQADAPNTIAGWTDANASVELVCKAIQKNNQASEKTFTAKADKRGYWEVRLPAFPKRTLFELTAKSGAENVKINNIITGELWLGSGQSNMEWNFSAGTVSNDYRAIIQKDIDESNNEIRFFKSDKNLLARPIDEVPGTWNVVNNSRDGNLSAVGYLFVSRLRKELDTPVGFINSSWGGSRVEPWISQKAFEESVDCKDIWAHHLKKIETFEKIRDDFDNLNAEFIEKYPTRNLQNRNRDKQPPQPYSATNFSAPAAMYNAQIHGIAPLAPRGVIWYQGESNTNEYHEYGKLIKLLVNSWREYFKTDFHFFYVELAAFTNKQTRPVELNRDSWAYIREAQAEVLELPKTGVAALADTGPKPEPVGDIHPPYKDVPADRLARLALAHVYKKMPVNQAIAPFYKSHKIENDKIIVDIDFAEGLRKKSISETLTGFAIRGDNNNEWKWANAEIKNNKIILSNPDIKKPEAARYGWAKYPLMSVENKHGLPLRQFSTDQGHLNDHKR